MTQRTTTKALSLYCALSYHYVKSQIEAVHRIYTDKEASIRALAKLIGRKVDRDVLERPGKTFSANPSCRKSVPFARGLKTILRTKAKGKPGKPEDFVEATFVREFDQSSFTDGHYKKR